MVRIDCKAWAGSAAGAGVLCHQKIHRQLLEIGHKSKWQDSWRSSNFQTNWECGIIENHMMKPQQILSLECNFLDFARSAFYAVTCQLQLLHRKEIEEWGFNCFSCFHKEVWRVDKSIRIQFLEVEKRRCLSLTNDHSRFSFKGNLTWPQAAKIQPPSNWDSRLPILPICFLEQTCVCACALFCHSELTKGSLGPLE